MSNISRLLERAAEVLASDETPYNWARGLISTLGHHLKFESSNNGIPNWLLGIEESAKYVPPQLAGYRERLLKTHKALLQAYQEMHTIGNELQAMVNNGALKRMESPAKYPCPQAPDGQHVRDNQDLCHYCGVSVDEMGNPQ